MFCGDIILLCTHTALEHCPWVGAFFFFFSPKSLASFSDVPVYRMILHIFFSRETPAQCANQISWIECAIVQPLWDRVDWFSLMYRPLPLVNCQRWAFYFSSLHWNPRTVQLPHAPTIFSLGSPITGLKDNGNCPRLRLSYGNNCCFFLISLLQGLTLIGIAKGDTRNI